VLYMYDACIAVHGYAKDMLGGESNLKE
jgi:hypothetical protein